MVSIKVECALSNGDIADDLECPLTTPNHPTAFCTAIYSFVTGEPRDFIFGTLTYHSNMNKTKVMISGERQMVRQKDVNGQTAVKWLLLLLLIYHSKSHPAEEKSSLKGAWSGSSNPF